MNCPQCGGEVWDNRQKKMAGQIKTNAPDFSCKDKVKCKWVQWPPKEKKASHVVGSALQRDGTTVPIHSSEPPVVIERRPSDDAKVALFWASFDEVLEGIQRRKLTDMIDAPVIASMTATLFIQRSK